MSGSYSFSVLLLASLALSWACGQQPEPVATVEPPNILLILAADVGREVLGSYGGTSYETPHLDDLATTGMRFDHTYSMPVCHPSRISLLTGRYPFQVGNPEWGTFPRASETQTVAHSLKDAGYATAIAGKWQLTLLKDDPDHPHRLGFDEYCLFGWHEGPRYYRPLIYQNGQRRGDVAERYGLEVYTEFLIDFIRRNRDRRFFAFYSMALCHDVTDDLEAPVPFGPRGRYDSYAEMVASMDEQIGRLVAALNGLGLREKTLILFTTDNGTAKRSIITAEGGKLVREDVVSRLGEVLVPGGKTELADGGTRVPTIANWPGMVEEATLLGDLIDFSDIFPTLAELGGAELPSGVSLPGKSFAPGLRGEQGTGRKWVFSEHQGQSWVRSHDWKLYRDGRLFHMASDSQEQRAVDAEVPAGAAEARQSLRTPDLWENEVAPLQPVEAAQPSLGPGNFSQVDRSNQRN